MGTAWGLDTMEAIAALPLRQRTAVALHYVADLSIADTATLMGVSVGTVTATLHAARANLGRTLADPEQERPTDG